MFTVRTKIGLFLAKTDKYHKAVEIGVFWERCGVMCKILDKNGRIVW